ncbi:MAG TPA: hypothetical protein DIU35_00195 [Candidatus Latescibacteria bacterium]|nr:hypothetical protein [Candidatus Latescibacterota bacterium]
MADVKYADGTVAVTPDNRVGAGDLGEWDLVFTLEEEPLPPGSAIRISMPQGFSPPQIDNPDAPGFVSASGSSGSSSISVSVDPFTAGEFDLHTGQGRTTGVTLYVERAPLKPQDRVTLAYGSSAGKAYASSFSGLATFEVFVCTDGRAYPERFFPVSAFPSLEVTSGVPHSLEVSAPSKGEPGSPLALRAILRDRLGNRCVGWTGWFNIECDLPGVHIPASSRQEDHNGEGVLLPVSLGTDVQGVIRLRVTETETKLEGVSNPILVGDTTPLWGDLHACLPSDGDYQSTLDFELPVGPSPTLDQTSFNFHTETSPDTSLSGPGPLHYSLPDAGSDEMLSSHLLEIYSCWGNREFWGARRADTHPLRHPDRTVHAVLSQGIIAGFAAGSNSRFGVAEDASRAEPGRGYRSGLTGVYAESATQESLFQAMRERRCFATSGPKIILRMDVSGNEMGKIVEVPADRRDLRQERSVNITVNGTTRIDRIEVVRNNIEVCTYRGEGTDVAFQWTDRQDLDTISLPRHMGRGASTCYYFSRVIQEDGEIAWSSPVWFVLRG